MQAQINRLSVIDFNKKKNMNEPLKILPHSQKSVRIQNKKSVLCKAKTYSADVYSSDTIVDEKKPAHN